uniref:SDR family NAD(P)-dependent oxidoreductase n=1 Tax=Aromatoleum anaerobium TaxID=182180 RepID=A0ABX1PR80_9RHOO
MPDTLKDKVAIVTGASRGIGAAIAERFAAEGAKVVLVARTIEPGGKLPGSLDETAARIRTRGGDCLCVQADLASEADRERIVADTIARYGGVDILVNNAAWARFGAGYTQPPQRVQLAYAVNLFAPHHLAQLVIASMKARGGGWILNLSSATSEVPGPAPYTPDDRAFRFHTTHSPTLYGSTKAALERLSAGMAMELAADNIAVNTLAPVEAVASDGALKSGSIDELAQMEPIEAMAEAALALCSRPQSTLSGRIVLSLPLLRELAVEVMRLDGTAPLPDFTP